MAFSGFLFAHLKPLKYMLRDNPHENILSPTKRSLVLEGRLILAGKYNISYLAGILDSMQDEIASKPHERTETKS